MGVRLYMDVHVPFAITEQLRRRGVDILTAAEDGAAELPDDQLLERVRTLGRLLFTQDIRFEVLARQLQGPGKALWRARFRASTLGHDWPVCQRFGADCQGV
jgi:predicted nuclease of predicted toxin-antitoxin system